MGIFKVLEFINIICDNSGAPLYRRGFEAGKRTKKDGTPNTTFDKTEKQHEAIKVGKVGRPSKK